MEKFRIDLNTNKGIKYEVIKVILIMKLIERYKSEKYWLGFYSEFELDEELVCSLYFLNKKTRKEVIYEITKDKISDKRYKEFEGRGYEFINIVMKDFPDDIKGIVERIEELV